MVKKVILKLKNKLRKNKDYSQLEEEYKFSVEEMQDLNEQNKQKLENLKLNNKNVSKVSFTSISKKLDGIVDNFNVDEIPIKEGISLDSDVIEDDNDEDSLKDGKKVLDLQSSEDDLKELSEKKENSYINLTDDDQKVIMDSWDNIDLQQIDKDIIEGKDLLNHNYNITYGDNAAKFVHDVRKKYEIVLCYLIGFNNEKRGIFNKTIFADRVDDEWKYLSNYVKLLEKIRSNRK